MLVIQATFLDRVAPSIEITAVLPSGGSFAFGHERRQAARADHLSGRYRDEEILGEAAKTFPTSRIIADPDHMVI